MMTNHLLRKFALLAVLVGLPAAIANQCDAQSTSRQSTPDPYFQPPKISIAGRYNGSGPYQPPQFGTQRPAAPALSQDPNSTMQSIDWAPPKTSVNVNGGSPNLPATITAPEARVAKLSSSMPTLSGWEPPTTPVKTGTLKLNRERNPVNVSQLGVKPEKAPLFPSSPRSIIREGQASASNKAVDQADQAGASQFISNPHIIGGASNNSTVSSFAPVATMTSAPDRNLPVSGQEPKSAASSPVAGSAFKSIAPVSPPANGSDKSFTSTARAEPKTTPVARQGLGALQEPQGNSAFGGSPLGNGAGVRVASRPNEFAQPAKPVKPAATSEAVESFELGRVLAVVGGEPVFVGDIMFEANQMIEQRAAQAPEADKVKLRLELVKRLLPKYVNEKMLFVSTLQGLPDGVDIEDIIEQATGQFDELELPKMIESSGVKNVAEFEANLRVQGSSIQMLRRSWAKTQIVRSFLGQQLNVNASVTHSELLDEYRANLAKYEVKAKSKWEQIMIRFDKVSSREEAQKMAKEVLDQVVYGGNFAAVAKKVSHGFRASEGGSHDWTTKGSLVLKEIDRAIFTLPIGKLSGIVESRDGLHIIRVTDRSNAGHVPFLEAQVEIKKQLLNKKRDDSFNKHLEKLKDEIPVEYYSAS